MAWETINSQSGGRGGHGPDWNALPAAAITKGGLSLNGPFASAFGYALGGYVRVLFDQQARLVGLKLVPKGESLVGAYKIQGTKNGSKGDGLTFTCKTLVPRIPDCIGHAYRAHLNPGEHVVQIELSPGNMLK